MRAEPSRSAGSTASRRPCDKRYPSDESVYLGDCSVSALILLSPDAGFPVTRRQLTARAAPAVDIDDLMEHDRLAPGMHHQGRVRRQEGERFQSALHRHRRQKAADIEKNPLQNG